MYISSKPKLICQIINETCRFVDVTASCLYSIIYCLLLASNIKPIDYRADHVQHLPVYDIPVYPEYYRGYISQDASEDDEVIQAWR